MFDSTVLKGMKLPELQEIAKLAKTIKFAGVKKEKLIEMILSIFIILKEFKSRKILHLDEVNYLKDFKNCAQFLYFDA